MKVYTLAVGGMASLCYLAVSDEEDEAVVIDPSVPPEAILARGQMLPPVSAILLTHAHFDHLLALEQWKKKTGAPIMIAAPDAPALTDPERNCTRYFFGEEGVYPSADRLLNEGDRISLGKELLTVMVTPGHTPGSAVFMGEGILFTGDTLMSDGGFGRYDLPGGSASELRASLSRIFALTGAFRVYPGHGRESTLCEERAYHSFD